MDDNVSLKHIQKNQKKLLEKLNERQVIIRDYVRGVAKNYKSGLYLYGRPGTAKTHTVRSVLDKMDEGYVYQRGHLTPIGLFDLLAEQPDSLIVLDDLVNIFGNDISLQILLGAMEPPVTKDRARHVTYQRNGTKKTVAFRGGLICITNRELHDSDLLSAFKSRVHLYNYDPTDAEIGAHLLGSASLGWPYDSPIIPPETTTEIATHVITQMTGRGMRFDLRIYYNKAIPDFLQWEDGETETHWKDLVAVAIEEHMVELKHGKEQRSREETRQGEVQLVRTIVQKHPNRDEQIKEWQSQTGKSSRAFYRRLTEVT